MEGYDVNGTAREYRPRGYRLCGAALLRQSRSLTPGLSEISGAGPVDHHAVTNLSSKMMANWVLAPHHSRGGIFHSPATWRKTRYKSFIAAPSVGSRARVRTARRSFAFKDSKALVSGMKIPAPIFRLGSRCFRRMAPPSGIEAPGAPSAGRPFCAMNGDFWPSRLVESHSNTFLASPGDITRARCGLVLN